MTIGQRAAAALGLTVVVGTMMGCTTPAAQIRLARRERSLRQIGQVLARLEAHRDRQCEHTVGLARRQYEDDVQTSQRNLSEIAGLKLAREEFERWKRRAPLYRRAVERQLAGHVDKIERTLTHGL